MAYIRKARARKILASKILARAYSIENAEFRLSLLSYMTSGRMRNNDAILMMGLTYLDFEFIKSEAKSMYWYRIGFSLGDNDCGNNAMLHFAKSGKFGMYIYWLIGLNRRKDKTARIELKSKLTWRKHNS